MEYIAHLVYNGKDNTTKFASKEECVNAILKDIFCNVGNGDMENGGKRSLWNCAPEIYKAISDGHSYSYADCKWYMGSSEGIDLEEAYEKVSKLALIEIENGFVHLVSTWNPDAELEDENCIEEEWYGWDGWKTEQTNPILVSDFWQIWEECNEFNAGGVDFNDNCTYKDVYDLLKELPNVTYKDIPSLKDGKYMVVGKSL